LGHWKIVGNNFISSVLPKLGGLPFLRKLQRHPRHLYSTSSSLESAIFLIFHFLYLHFPIISFESLLVINLRFTYIFRQLTWEFPPNYSSSITAPDLDLKLLV
jgi:hypothetical protein